MTSGEPHHQGGGGKPPPATIYLQFVMMLRKNILQQRRRPVSLILEALLPVFLVLALVAISQAATITDEPAEQFAAAQDVVPIADSVASAVCSRLGSAAASFLPLCNASVVTRCGSRHVPLQGFCVYPRRFAAVQAELSFATTPVPLVPPSMDTLQTLRWATWVAAGDDAEAVRDVPADLRPFQCPGPLHFAPDTVATRNLMAFLNSTTKTTRFATPKLWPTVAAATDFIKGSAFRWPDDCVTALIEVRSLGQLGGSDLVLHLNRTAVPSTAVKHYKYTNGIPVDYGKPYILGGFVSMQLLAADYLRSALGLSLLPLPDGATPSPAPQSFINPLVATPMPFAEYNNSQFLNFVGNLAPLFIVFGYLFAVSQLTKRLVVEKETRTREAMHIMGLSYGPFLLSWLVTYAVPVFLSSIIITATLALAVLDKTNAVLIFLLFLCFGTSTIALSTFLAAFFSKSRIAAIVAPVAFFVMALPSFALPDRTPSVAHVFLSVLSPSAFAEGTKLLFNLQRTTGAGMHNLFEENPGSYPLGVSIFMLAVDTVLYVALGVYVDAVMPSEWGVPKHPLFCIRFPWCPWSSVWGEAADEAEEARDSHHDVGGTFEEIDRAGRTPSVEMCAMRRVFDTDGTRTVAVDNLTHALYDGEISVLLGHNGAGKTTAINMMTGMLGMTSGDCYLAGHSVRHELRAVRQEIGMCPQHNILWEELTCKEHLEFFAGLKGNTSSEDRSAEAVRMLHAVDLADKADVAAGSLSGGMKRKLSVAVAFTGSPRVVFLDEPTAGMDVATRRFTWDLIKQMSPGRTIVLTTHFMDEADLLGNTIAIMSKGRLQCVGSSMFLKNRLGVGYTLTVACDSSRTGLAAPIVDLVKSHVHDANVLSEHAAELTMQLPMAGIPRFPALLESLENTGASLGVRGHGLSVTTLEEVFLRLAHEPTAGRDTDAAALLPIEDPTANAGTPLMKAAAVALSDDLCVQDRYSRIFTQRQGVEATLSRQLWSLLVKRLHNAKRDRKAQVVQLLLPVLCLLLAMLLTLIKFDNEPGIAMLPSEYGTTETPLVNCPAAFLTSGLPSSNVLNASTAAVSPVSEPTPQALSRHLLVTANAHTYKRLSSVVCNPSNVSVNHGAVAAYIMNNGSGWPHSLPLAVQEYAVMSMRTLTADPTLRFEVSSLPLPLTQSQKFVVGRIQGFVIGVFVMIPFTFIPATFVAWVVREREHKTKHLQTVSGMHYTMYWASNFVFDFCSFLITAVLALIIFACFNREEYIGTTSSSAHSRCCCSTVFPLSPGRTSSRRSSATTAWPRTSRCSSTSWPASSWSSASSS